MMHNEYLMPSVNKYDQKMLEKVNTPAWFPVSGISRRYVLSLQLKK